MVESREESIRLLEFSDLFAGLQCTLVLEFIILKESQKPSTLNNIIFQSKQAFQIEHLSYK